VQVLSLLTSLALVSDLERARQRDRNLHRQSRGDLMHRGNLHEAVLRRVLPHLEKHDVAWPLGATENARCWAVGHAGGTEERLEIEDFGVVVEPDLALVRHIAGNRPAKRPLDASKAIIEDGDGGALMASSGRAVKDSVLRTRVSLRLSHRTYKGTNAMCDARASASQGKATNSGNGGHGRNVGSIITAVRGA